MKSNISGIHLRDLILWKAIHSSQISPSPNISNIEGTSSQVSRQQDTLHVAVSLNEPFKHLSKYIP